MNESDRTMIDECKCLINETITKLAKLDKIQELFDSRISNLEKKIINIDMNQTVTSAQMDSMVKTLEDISYSLNIINRLDANESNALLNDTSKIKTDLAVHDGQNLVLIQNVNESIEHLRSDIRALTEVVHNLRNGVNVDPILRKLETINASISNLVASTTKSNLLGKANQAGIVDIQKNVAEIRDVTETKWAYVKKWMNKLMPYIVAILSAIATAVGMKSF